uniref:DUF1918 domain-containing protein n=1 Tax=Kitasatospora indigofera TaxID=67307 RepID=UPI002F90F939
MWVVRVSVGDRLRFPGRRVGMADRLGRVVEVRGADGAPPYLVEFEDGHRSEVFPGPDCHLEPRNTWTPGHP